MNGRRRVQLLRAMGLEPQVLRGSRMDGPAGDIAALVVVAPASAEPAGRERDLLDRLLAVIPVQKDRIQCLWVIDNTLSAQPASADVFFVLGGAQQEALDKALQARGDTTSTMAGAPTLAELLAQPLRKREAWQAIGQVRSALRGL